MAEEQQQHGGIHTGIALSASNNNSITQRTQMLCCNFNQDGSCLSIGTTKGFVIYTLSPSTPTTPSSGRADHHGNQFEVQLSVNRQHLSGGIGYIEMLFRCNLLVLVGGGNSPYNQSHKVLIWDDHANKIIGELSFRQVVLSCKLRRDSIAVSLRDRIYVYNLSDLSLRDKIYTTDNPLGLLSLSTSASTDMVLACPSVTVGHVRVELYGLRKTVLMEAHESSLRQISLNSDGTKLLTCSVKGTIIRVWDITSGGNCIQEFRRGYERTNITCLCWSYTSDYIACCSDKGTTHVFSLVDYNNNQLQQQQQQQSNNNSNENKTSSSRGSSSSSMTSRLFKSISKTVSGGGHSSSSSSSPVTEHKSIAQIRGIPHPKICAFLPDQPNVITTVGYDADGNGVVMKNEFYDTNPIAMSNNATSTSSSEQQINNGHTTHTTTIVSHHHHHHSTAVQHKEPRRICYHVVAKVAISKDDDNIDDDDIIEDDTKRRRRRMLGLTPSGAKVPGTEPPSPSRSSKKGDDDGGDTTLQHQQQLHIGERLEILEGMKNIVVQEEEDDDGFISISTKAKSTTTTTTTTSTAAKKNDDDNDSKEQQSTAAEEKKDDNDDKEEAINDDINNNTKDNNDDDDNNDKKKNTDGIDE